jgi:hypothetical protein
MNPPNVNPTPKARFQESGNNIAEHHTLLESRPFQRACDFGLQQYMLKLATVTGDFNTAAAAGFKMQGAQEFLATLRLLAEKPEPVKPPELVGQLNYRA